MDLQVSIQVPGNPLKLDIKICESSIKTKITVLEDDVDSSAGYKLQPYTASWSLLVFPVSDTLDTLFSSKHAH